MNDMRTLKAEQLTSTKWRVLAIPFGGPKGGKDRDGEFFSPRTDIKADWFDRRPVLWHHGKDPEMKDDTIGIEDDLEKKSDGWWATVWLDRAARYWAEVNRWLGEERVYGSSGALGHIVKRDGKTGEILVWPHIEQTLTLTPANFYSRLESAKAAADFTSAGITVDLEAYLTQVGEPSARLHTATLDVLEELIKTI